MKQFTKTVLAVYLLALLWLVLFKLSYDITGVLFEHQSRAINLIPFYGYSQGIREMIVNFIVFVPSGLLLGILFKQTSFGQKLGFIFAFSLGVEIIQYVLAIGLSDITDLITNTLGGLAGLGLYALGNKYIDSRKLDWFIVIAIALLWAALLFLRLFVLKVRY